MYEVVQALIALYIAYTNNIFSFVYILLGGGLFCSGVREVEGEEKRDEMMINL